MDTHNPDDELPRAPALVLPLHCITSSSLHSLARALERLASFHRHRGGAAPDVPCLTHVFVDDHEVIARVVAGTSRYKLRLVRDEWVVQ